MRADKGDGGASEVVLPEDLLWIRANGIAPGAIRTSINAAAWTTAEAYAALMTLVPCGRIDEPEDVGRAAVWLASDDSDYVIGATLFVDGSMALHLDAKAGGNVPERRWNAAPGRSRHDWLKGWRRKEETGRCRRGRRRR